MKSFAEADTFNLCRWCVAMRCKRRDIRFLVGRRNMEEKLISFHSRPTDTFLWNHKFIFVSAHHFRTSSNIAYPFRGFYFRFPFACRRMAYTIFGFIHNRVCTTTCLWRENEMGESVNRAADAKVIATSALCCLLVFSHTHTHTHTSETLVRGMNENSVVTFSKECVGWHSAVHCEEWVNNGNEFIKTVIVAAYLNNWSWSCCCCCRLCSEITKGTHEQFTATLWCEKSGCKWTKQDNKLNGNRSSLAVTQSPIFIKWTRIFI